MGQVANLPAHFPTNVNLTPDFHDKPTRPISASTASSSQAQKPKSRDDFTIAIFCALPLEAEVVDAFFHTRWRVKDFGKPSRDPNAYTLGAIGKLNVVLVHMGGMGKGEAARAAANCRMSFVGIEIALVVGICGGVPSDIKGGNTERLLGDIVISDGVVQHDLGKQFPGQFVRKSGPENYSGISSPKVKHFLTLLKGRRALAELHNATWISLNTLQNDNFFRESAAYPGANQDNLYESSYVHKHREPDNCENWMRTCGKDDRACAWARSSNCEDLKCESSRLVSRTRLSGSPSNVVKPTIHIGLLGSGDSVMKSGQDRDRIASKENIIGFEMEGAGVREALPCVVIKAICDYADSHKSKVWQKYAAATAGACMAAFLDQWESNKA